MKHKSRIFRTVLYAAALLMLPVLLIGCTKKADNESAVNVEIVTPSAGELVIAPGRHFKVSGKLSGNIPKDAVLKVSLLDSSGNEIRYAMADKKGTDRVVPNSIGGDLAVFVEGTEFSEVAFTAPELVVSDPGDPQASAHDATIKCVYTDETFYALIVSATDTKHGLTIDDGYYLTDHSGNPYEAFPKGRYTVKVELSSDGKELASASEEIEIGFKSGTVIHEVTTPTAVEKGGMDLLASWAAENDLTILGDLLPGMFGPFYQMSTLPLAVGCEDSEYLPGKIMMLVYANWDMSPSNGLELARYLQAEHNTDDPDIAEYYYFSLGEPSLAGERSKIVKFGEEEKIHIYRIDLVKSETQDGVFLRSEEQLTGSDTDPSDGWTTGDSEFAVCGVMKPYQLKDEEIVPLEDMHGFYLLLNGPDTLVYTFTPRDGSGEFSVSKSFGVRRVGVPGDDLGPAVYEFYNVFPAGILKEGIAYDVVIQAYDRNGEAIKDASCSFTLNQ